MNDCRKIILDYRVKHQVTTELLLTIGFRLCFTYQMNRSKSSMLIKSGQITRYQISITQKSYFDGGIHVMTVCPTQNLDGSLGRILVH